MASRGLEEFTGVFFRVITGRHVALVVVLCSDLSRSTLHKGYDKRSFGTFLDVDPVHGKLSLSLRCLIDHSIVEAFGGGGKVSITARVYPTRAIAGAAHLFVFNNGAKDVGLANYSAWNMKKAIIN